MRVRHLNLVLYLGDTVTHLPERDTVENGNDGFSARGVPSQQ
jgi:hypothetical protein